MGTFRQDRVAILGAGHVGATTAYALMLRALFREIVLIDSHTELAAAEAADLLDANAMARPARIWSGSYADAASAQIAVITAGAATHGEQSRLSVAARSGAIVAECASGLSDAGFNGVLLVAANPVDLMCHVALRHSRLPPARVIGTGTLLDSSRLRQRLGAHLHVAPGAIEGFVFGEHGDSELAAFSTVRIGGLPLDRFVATEEAPSRRAMAEDVRTAGYDIIAGKGYTSFGVATAIVRICEAIVRDEHAIVPVSTLIDGQFGIVKLYLSLPCLLGADGVERIVTPDLTGEEETALLASAAVLRKALADFDRVQS